MARKHVVSLSAEELREVADLWKNGGTHLVRLRALMLLFSTQGYGIGEIAVLLNVARSTVQRIAHRFEISGAKGLHNPARPGRPPRCQKEDEEFLLGLLAESPRDHGYQTNTWSCALLAAQLREHRGVQLSPARVRELLRARRARQVRPNHYLARADEEAKKGLWTS